MRKLIVWGNMQFKYRCLAVIAPLVFILDQITKYFVVEKMPLGSSTPVVNGYFDIVHYTNAGAAFGFLSSLSASLRTPFFYAVSVIALIVIIIYMVKLPAADRIMPVALSLVVGGIFGNGIDRVRCGHVTDFLSVHIGSKALWGINLEWPAFNVADSAITVAMALLIISAFRKQ